MDIIDLACPILRTPFLEHFMALASYFGHGAVGSVVSLLFLAHGYTQNNQRTKRTGVALLVALIIVGITTWLLKAGLQLPRPNYKASFGFPSGRTGAAFSMAATLGFAFPAVSPLLYLPAVLTGISRLYLRTNVTWDVIGGVIIGLLSGVSIARTLVPRSANVKCGLLGILGWLGTIAIGVNGIVFFHSIDKRIRAHLVIPTDVVQTASAIATVDFGTPDARQSLRYGWSGDEWWLNGKQSVVWAAGLGSELTFSLPETQDFRFRLHVFPYAPKGTACQRIEVKMNDSVVTKVHLERGWHWYEFKVPKVFVRGGKNDLQFVYDYADSPKSRNRGPDDRLLSVAFDRLDVFLER